MIAVLGGYDAVSPAVRGFMSRLLFIKTRQVDFYERYCKAASPPLGLMHLAAHAREHRPGKDKFLLLDERVQVTSDADYATIIGKFQPDLIGLSVLTTEADRMSELIALLGRVAPDTRILIGGPHATAEGPGIMDEFPHVYVVRGEAENAFVKLLACFDRGDYYPTERISGLMYTSPTGALVEVPYGIDDPDVATLSRPAYDLVNFDLYEKNNRMTIYAFGRRYAPLFTSRGCPYRCTYCHDIFGKGFRAQTPEQVVDDIQYLIENHGIHEFEVYDDIFNADYKRTMGICDEIKRRNLKTAFSFPNGIRGDRFDKPLLQALADVGTYHMAFAVESASPRIQKLIKKHVKIDKIHENITIAANVGIFTWGFFMLGFPTETRKEMQATVDFGVSSDLHGAFFFKVMPFGGTELTREFIPDDMRVGLYDSPLLSGENLVDADYMYGRNNLSTLTSEELHEVQWTAMKRFYFNPRRWTRVLRDYPFGTAKAIKKGLGFSKYLLVNRDYSEVSDGLADQVLAMAA